MTTIYSVNNTSDRSVYRETYPGLVNIDSGPWVTLASSGWRLSGITLDDVGNVYVFAYRTTGQARIYQITPGGSSSIVYDDAFNIGMDGPGGVDWNPVDGLLYVWDSANHFFTVTTGGTLNLIDTGYLVVPSPSGIRCTPDGAVWFVDSEGNSGTSPAINRYDPDTDTFAEAHGVGTILTEAGDPLPRADSSIWHTLDAEGHEVTSSFVDSTIDCMTDDPVGVDFATMRAWYRNGTGLINVFGDYYEVGPTGCPTLIGTTTLTTPVSFAADFPPLGGWTVGRVSWGTRSGGWH